MKELQAILANLKKEIPYQWRVQSRTADKRKAICSAFIDARSVMSVLDQHCINGWETDVKEVAGFIFFGIGIHVQIDQVGIKTFWRWDTGSRIEENKNDHMYEQAGKSASSDAFKRAAVQWGIGRFLYDIATVTVDCDEKGNPINERGERIWNLTEHISKAPVKSKNKGRLPGAGKPTPAESDITSNQEPSATIPAPVDPVRQENTAPPADGPKPKLSSKSYDAMVKAINEGRKDEVKAAMDKYDLTLQQKTVLTTLINTAK